MSYSVFPTIFPENFTWGAATASYQIEGAVNEAGRGLSIWDTFSHLPGTTANGDTGDVACDHYHRWQSDVKLMADLGMQSYRFSIAWSRVIPNGTGAVNEAGLDFYDQLVNGLLAANITPWVTLYHWDLPQALQDNGGWANRDTVNAFVAYSDLVVRRLGDRVKHWITHNEPWVVSFAGNYQGRHAPGIRDLPTALQVSHNLLLSHGLAVPVIRAASHEAQVGITLNFSPARPASAAPEDIAAAKLHDGYVNRWFLDPLYGHGYPADMVALYGAAMHDIGPKDLEQIAVPTDFLGANYYYPGIVRHVETDVNPLGFAPISSKELAAAGYELTEMGWPIVPDAFTNLLTRLHSDYNPGAIYITENGAAFDDQVENGTVHDAQRIAYLYGHLKAVKDAITAGVPVKGYFVWSLLDNFEWALGYGKRFGIVYIDYKTQARIPKASAEWYRRVIAAHAVVDATESA
jgi:beta-glucosidase